jgi:peptidoglycan/LPS O-acetylase OafA/YrhL
MQNGKQLLLWVQSLRGIAALLVVLVHARYILVDPIGKELGQLFLYPAAMGVDLFFLVSGFIMAVTTANFDPANKRSYAVDFAIKRFARVWPLYAIITVSSLTLGAGFSVVIHHYKALILQSFLFIPIHPEIVLYFGMPVEVAWTLCFEFYFYAVLACSLLAGRYRWWAVAAWFAITLVVYPLLTGQESLNVFKREPILWLRYANVAVNPIVWDFIFGLVVGGIYMSRLLIRNTLILHLMVFASCMVLLVQAITGTDSVHGPAGWGGALFPLLLSLALLSKVTDVYFPKWTVWLGEISYSLYLTHLYAFQLVHKLVASATPWMRDPAKSSIVDFVLSPAVAIMVATVVYYFLERPASIGTRLALLKLHARRTPTSYRGPSPVPTVPTNASAGR